jgi:bla regulator protein BlaR1
VIAVLAWAGSTLFASTTLMLLVLAIRTPVKRWAGPQLGYVLWAIPALRIVLPSLRVDTLSLPTFGAAVPMSVLFIGPRGSLGPGGGAESSAIGAMMLTIWLAVAIGLFTLFAIRHFSFCHRLRATAVDLGCVGTVRILAADVEGPLAFGVFRRFIAVPRNFRQDYDAREQDLALAHECVHHARGDLLANWASLLVLATHWWNPIAWIAIRAFRDDQELAADAQVLDGREAAAVPLYARVLAKAAGIGMPPACNLHARFNLKRRLMTLGRVQRSRRPVATGTLVLTLLGGAALAVSATTISQAGLGQAGQVATIGVKPDGTGGYTLLVSGKVQRL